MPIISGGGADLLSVFRDQSPYDGVRRYYVVCSTPRTGSSLLCELLARTGVGVPMEYFHPRKYMPNFLQRYGLKVSAASDVTVEDYIEALKYHRTSPTGYFGFKAHRGQFKWLARNCQLGRVFPGIRYVFVSRRDTLAQAVSASKAAQSRQWSSEQAAIATPQYDEEHIRFCLKTINKANDYWRTYFEEHAIQPLCIEYEDLVSSTTECLGRVLQFLDAADLASPIGLHDVRMRRQSDAVNAEWIARYQERND